MKTSSHWLPERIKQRLQEYSSEDIERTTTLLGDLLNTDIRRAEQIDSKATLLLGYAGAIITLVFPSLLRESGHSGYVSFWVSVVALGAAVMAAAAAFLAFRARSGWRGYTDETLFPAISERCDLARFRALATHGLYVRHVDVTRNKLRWVLKAQLALMISIGAVGATVGIQLPTLLPTLWP
jgi:hypothetical protein